jgi:ribosomal protein L34E
MPTSTAYQQDPERYRAYNRAYSHAHRESLPWRCRQCGLEIGGVDEGRGRNP